MSPPRLFLIALLALGLAACSTPARHYYILSAESPMPSGGGKGIGLGPIALAGHLDRPNLVIQETPESLGIAESHHWGGSLEQNISRALATDLGRALHTGFVLTYPWSNDAGLTYQIAVDIHHFEGDPQGNAVLDATWRVYSLPDRGMVATRSWSGKEPQLTDGYDALVAAESKLLGRLAREIASSLHSS